jgi:hypothetical protein
MKCEINLNGFQRFDEGTQPKKSEYGEIFRYSFEIYRSSTFIPTGIDSRPSTRYGTLYLKGR